MNIYFFGSSSRTNGYDFATHTTQNDRSTSGEETINRHLSLRIFSLYVLCSRHNVSRP